MKKLEILNENGVVVAGNIFLADSFSTRRTGLLKHKKLDEGEGCLICPCKQVHTFGMKFAIDIIFLSEEGEILHIVESVRAGKMSKYVSKAAKVLELRAGAANSKSLRIKDKLYIAEFGLSRREPNMSEKSKNMKLQELREGIAEPGYSAFSKKLIGGYNPKDVSEYVKTLNERLQHAEISFNEKLEEYSSMVLMLTEERDEYAKQVKAAEEKSIALEHTMRLMESKIEEQLKRQRTNLEEENLRVIEANQSLNLEVQNLKNTIEEKIRNTVSREELEIALSEKELINTDFDKMAKERSVLLAEKNILLEETNRLKNDIKRVTEEKRDLNDENCSVKLKLRSTVSSLEAKVYEYAHNHESNVDTIRENIRKALELLDFENADIAKLLRVSSDETLI